MGSPLHSRRLLHQPMLFNSFNCNAGNSRIDWEIAGQRVISRLWCSGSTIASQALSEGSIPFSRFVDTRRSCSKWGDVGITLAAEDYFDRNTSEVVRDSRQRSARVSFSRRPTAAATRSKVLSEGLMSFSSPLNSRLN